jgi:hypothetical protein
VIAAVAWRLQQHMQRDALLQLPHLRAVLEPRRLQSALEVRLSDAD